MSISLRPPSLSSFGASFSVSVFQSPHLLSSRNQLSAFCNYPFHFATISRSQRALCVRARHLGAKVHLFSSSVFTPERKNSFMHNPLHKGSRRKAGACAMSMHTHTHTLTDGRSLQSCLFFLSQQNILLFLNTEVKAPTFSVRINNGHC